MIPPSKKPKAIEKPGKIAFATRATTQAVIKTTRNAKLKMIRRHFHSSFHEAPEAASKSSGGRKIIKIHSGSTFICGIPGSKLSAKPAKTSKIG